MGQQQLLLILLGVILIGVAVTVGINMFSANSLEQKRNEIISEGIILASEAQLFYRKTVVYGGGGRTFTDWTVPSQYQPTAAGNFTATVTAQEVIITCIGNEEVTAGVPIEVKITVHEEDWFTTIIH
ncbi:MAG: hypothetical protein GY936_00705 [Ignavibacteriae bacterium]|nr:hypothetical protein [Ignavibacteriota bacterium]